jgi:hypothetical protein
MTETTVHLEDVTRAARQGLAVALTASLLALAGLLLAGLTPAIALPGAIGLLVVGAASGGFGLVARITLRQPRPKLGRTGADGGSVAPLRVPQTR